MIYLVETGAQRKKLLDLCEKTSFGCKISSIATAYGFDKSFASFWLDTRQEVAYCLSDGVMLLSGTVLYPEGIPEFLRMVGAASLFCAVRNGEALGLAPSCKGDVLKHLQPAGDAPLAPPPPVSVREIYALLAEVGMVGEFEPFYLDLSHKLRHRAALALAVPGEDGLDACAVVSSVNRGAAILSAVAVREGRRRQGLGSRLVRQAQSYFPGKTLYVFREAGKNREFYQALGYAKADTWVHVRL